MRASRRMKHDYIRARPSGATGSQRTFLKCDQMCTLRQLEIAEEVLPVVTVGRDAGLEHALPPPLAMRCSSKQLSAKITASAFSNWAGLNEELATMSMADRDGYIWYDGKLVPWRSATTHVLTHSLHYGLAVFEGIRAYNTVDGTAVFRLAEHIERLYNSAHIYMMKIPYSRETIVEAHKEVVRANKLVECYLRPIAFYGSEKMGVSPKGATVHVAIAAWPWGAYLGAEGLEKGIRVKTSSFARHHVNVSMCRAKYSGTYANSILANQEALEHGYDEGLLLDVDGFVAEGAGENLFIVKNGCIYEPELTSALMGITRDSVITLAAELGYTVTPRRVTRDDLYIADEAFFTGTAAEVTPIREVDGRAIGAGHRGPVTAKLQKAFFKVVKGKDKRHQDWLAPVAAGKSKSAAGKSGSAAGKPKSAARNAARKGKL